MSDPVPYEVIDRAPWPKTATSEAHEMRRLGPDDEAAFRALRDETGATGDGSVSFDRLVAWGAVRHDGGVLDAAFAVEPVNVMVGGEPRSWARFHTACVREVADVLADPPLLTRLGHAFFAAEGGREAIACTFGAPGFDALLLGRRPGAPGHALEYAVVRTESVLQLAAGDFDARKPHLPDFPVAVEDGAPAALTALDERFADQWGAALARDAESLARRYPADRYRTLVRADDQGTPQAAAIVARSSWPQPEALVLADWLCAPDDYESGLAIIRRAVRLAEEENASCVAILLPEWTPWFHHLQWHGFIVHPVDEVLLARAYVKPEGPAWLRERFAYGAGDLRLA